MKHINTSKSLEAQRRELRRISLLLDRRADFTEADWNGLYGAQQALAWAIGGYAAMPTRCFRPRKHPSAANSERGDKGGGK